MMTIGIFLSTRFSRSTSINFQSQLPSFCQVSTLFFGFPFSFHHLNLFFPSVCLSFFVSIRPLRCCFVVIFLLLLQPRLALWCLAICWAFVVLFHLARCYGGLWCCVGRLLCCRVSFSSTLGDCLSWMGCFGPCFFFAFVYPLLFNCLKT